MYYKLCDIIMKVIINLIYSYTMQPKNKKIYVLLIIGGILMLVINILLIFMEGGKFSNYMGIIAGLAFAFSGFSSIKKISKENI